VTSKERLLAVLKGKIPDRVPFAPNIWQWFEYRKLHGLLPTELQDCDSHLEATRRLGFDVFSRNLATDIRMRWFGSHAIPTYRETEVVETIEADRRHLIYRTSEGMLSEVLEFQREGCTLVQLEYLFKDFDKENAAWKSLYRDLQLSFDWESFHRLSRSVGDEGIVIAGEITSPLKQLHLCARADQTTFLLVDHEVAMMELMAIYAEKALGLIEEMVRGGVQVIMSMDNLDSTFYPPPYFERYCTEFYSRAAEICHRHGAYLFSHACGNQRSILPQVVQCGIDGLEGIAFPPLGDIDLWDAREAGDSFIVVGGLSAVELEGPVTQQAAEEYVKTLFHRMRPFERFIFSMSCNTSIRTRWDTLRYYRDAWMKYGSTGN
jgi:uroporphyrinogen-III decarboxylase